MFPLETTGPIEGPDDGLYVLFAAKKCFPHLRH